MTPYKVIHLGLSSFYLSSITLSLFFPPLLLLFCFLIYAIDHERVLTKTESKKSTNGPTRSLVNPQTNEPDINDEEDDELNQEAGGARGKGGRMQEAKNAEEYPSVLSLPRKQPSKEVLMDTGMSPCNTSLIFLFYFIFFHFISFHFILFHFISFHFISFHFISFHFISFHFISFHFISFHFISFHFISFHFISFHFISFHFISFHFISFHFISFHFISFHFISFHFISFHFISFHFISFHFILFYFIFSLLVYFQSSNSITGVEITKTIGEISVLSSELFDLPRAR